jgi:putative membrane protein
MYYDDYHFGGMHFGWWFIWGLLFFWIFVTPYDIPGRRKRRHSSFDILHKRLTSGQITEAEYQVKRKFLEDE